MRIRLRLLRALEAEHNPERKAQIRYAIGVAERLVDGYQSTETRA
jgi:hypothetical protein